MSGDRDLKVRLTAEGERSVQTALQGVSRAAQQSSRSRRLDSNETRKAVERQEAQIAATVRRSVRRSVDDVRQAERRKRDEVRETARETERALQREARARARANRDGGGRGRGGAGGGGRSGGGGGGFGRFGGRALSAGAGIATAAYGRLQGFQGALGVPSRDELVQMYIRTEQDFIRTAAQAGLSRDRRAEIQGRVMEVSRATNTDPTQLFNALTIAQNRFSDLGSVADNLNTFASAAQATGSSVEDWVGAAGEFQRQLGVTSQEVPQLVGAMVQAARQGSIEAGDVAANFSPLMSRFVALRGEGGRGASGAREFLALAEGLGASGAGPEGTRTLMENLFTSLQRGQVRNRIESRLHDRNIFDRGGRLTIGIDELLGRMSQDEAFRTPAGLERLGFTDVQAQTGMVNLMNLFRGGGNPITDLKNASAEEGQRTIDETMRELMGSTSGQALNQQITAQTNFMENGQHLVQVMTDLTGPLTDFQTRMPITSEALSFLGEAARNAGISVAAMRFFGMGGGAVPAAGGAAPAAAGGGALSWVLGPLAAGAAGFLGTIALANETGLFHTGDADARRRGMGRNLGQQWEDIGQGINAAFGVNWFDDAAPTAGERRVGATGADPRALREAVHDAVHDRPLRVEVVNPQATTASAAPSDEARRGMPPRARNRR